MDKPISGGLQAYLSHLVGLSYFARRLFLAKRNRPKYPHFIYKYRRILPENPVSVGHLRDILVDSKLWMSSPRDFNDPFDMTAHVIFEADTKSRLARFKELVDTNSKGLNWKQRKRQVDQFMLRPADQWQKEAAKAFEAGMDSIGVVSFAGDPKSILMWSHYGNYHTGVCLQFEIARDVATFLRAIPVAYSPEYPVLNWAEDTGNQILIPLLRKYQQWSYENERRIIMPDEGRKYLPFRPEALVGIVLGCNITDKTAELVTNLLDERDKKGLPRIRTYFASKRERKYALSVHRASASAGSSGGRGRLFLEPGRPPD